MLAGWGTVFAAMVCLDALVIILAIVLGINIDDVVLRHPRFALFIKNIYFGEFWSIFSTILGYVMGSSFYLSDTWMILNTVSTLLTMVGPDSSTTNTVASINRFLRFFRRLVFVIYLIRFGRLGCLY